MSYMGALALLGITAGFTVVYDRSEPAEMRPLLVFSGVWFAVGMLPTVFWLRESAVAVPARAATVITGAFVRLAESARETARYRHLARFFLAFSVYSAGTMTMIYGLGLIGDRLGFDLPRLILMALVIAVTAGASAAVAGRFQDSFGHTRTIGVFLAIWVVTTLAMAGAEFVSPPAEVYFGVAALIGIALGGIGTSSRAIVGAFTPISRAGEFFGLWGMIYKLSGIAGVGLFGLISKFAGQPVALLIVAGMFSAGWMLLLRVDEEQGIRAAGHGESNPFPPHPLPSPE
jgi:UMF1 family MFS transporter